MIPRISAIGKRFLSHNWHYVLVVFFGVVLTSGLWGYLWRVAIGDDYSFHFVRLQSAYEGWQDGQIIPQINPNALGGVGYAYNLFYGPLVTYFAAFLRVFIVSWPIIVNLVYIATMIASGIVMCWVMMRITQRKQLSSCIGILYMMAPYHLCNVYSRMALGELAALCFVPFLILALYRLAQKQEIVTRYFVIAGVGILLSHNASILVFGVMVLLFLLFNFRNVVNIMNLKKLIIASLVILGITAFFWLPLLETKSSPANYGIMNQAYSDIYFGTSAAAMNQKYLRLSSYSLEHISYSYTTEQNLAIGVIGVIALAGYWLIRAQLERQERKFLDTLYAITIIMFIVMGGWFPWQIMPRLFYQLQFPWRFLGVVTITTSIIAGYVICALIECIHKNTQRLALFLILLTVIYPSLWYVAPNAERHLETGISVDYSATNLSAGSQVEYAPLGLICPDNSDPLEEINFDQCGPAVVERYLDQRTLKGVVVLAGIIEINNYEKEGTNITMDLASENGGTVEVPLIYYPGYRVRASGTVTTGVSEHGLLTLEVPAGFRGEVKVYYGLSTGLLLGCCISSITILGVIVWFWYQKSHKISLKKR